MYEIIATRDFIDLLRKLPIKYAHILTRSFVCIHEIKWEESDNTFIDDLLEQIKNMEME